MGLYGSKDQHPKLMDTPKENQYLSNLKWWYCEVCGNKHLQQYKVCPLCGRKHRRKTGWAIFWAIIALLEAPVVIFVIYALSL